MILNFKKWRTINEQKSDDKGGESTLKAKSSSGGTYSIGTKSADDALNKRGMYKDPVPYKGKYHKDKDGNIIGYTTHEDGKFVRVTGSAPHILKDVKKKMDYDKKLYDQYVEKRNKRNKSAREATSS